MKHSQLNLRFTSCLATKSHQAKSFTFCDRPGQDLVNLGFSDIFGKILFIFANKGGKIWVG